MKQPQPGPCEFSRSEIRFLAQLRAQPELWARFQSILALTTHADGPWLTADAVEERVIQEVRQLGHTAMNQWAAQAQQRVSDELQASQATVRSRKKNAAVGVCLRPGARAGSGLAQPESELSAAPARAAGRHLRRTVPAAGPGVDGLWQRTILGAGRRQRAGT